jgi:hypothetical protein
MSLMKFIEIQFALILLCALACCSSNKQESSNDQPDGVNSANANSITESESDSVITKEGNYYKFIFLDSNQYRIKWGNQTKAFVSDKTFQVGSRGLMFTESSHDAILLTQSCGTSCKQGVILLLSAEQATLKEYMLLKAYNIKKNVVAYVSTNENSFIIIENFLTGKRTELKDVDLCPATLPTECIDSCGLSDNSFYIKWQGDKWSREKRDTREKIIDISSILSK